MRLTVCFLILMIPIHGPITRYKIQVYPTQDETYCLFPYIDDSYSRSHYTLQDAGLPYTG